MPTSTAAVFVCIESAHIVHKLHKVKAITICPKLTVGITALDCIKVLILGKNTLRGVGLARFKSPHKNACSDAYVHYEDESGTGT